MAVLTTVSSANQIRPWSGVRIRHFPEDASQVFKRGEVLIQGGAGIEHKVKRAADAPVAAIVGVAAEDASGTTDNKVAVYVAEAGAYFCGIGDATDTVDFSDLGVAVALELDDTNDVWTVETDNATDHTVVVHEFRHPVTRNLLTAEGDTNPLVVFRFVEAGTVYGDAN